MNKQLLIGQLSLPDPNYLTQVTSDSRKFMREHVLVLISGMRCDEEVDPLTYATGTTQSYRFYKNYQTKKETSPTYIHSDVCACCGNYRVYNGCKNSMCNCTNSYQEWTEYDMDNEYELREYEEFQDWHTAMIAIITLRFINIFGLWVYFETRILIYDVFDVVLAICLLRVFASLF